jgi:hypothetical protein
VNRKGTRWTPLPSNPRMPKADSSMRFLKKLNELEFRPSERFSAVGLAIVLVLALATIYAMTYWLSTR